MQVLPDGRPARAVVPSGRVIRFAVLLPLVGTGFCADQREDCAKRLHTTKWSPPAQALLGFLLEGFEDQGGGVGDRACAKGEDSVARCGFGDDGGDRLGDGGAVGDLAGVGGADGGGEGRAVDAGDRFFAGGVDVEQVKLVGISEGCGELGHQVAGAGVAVRLEEDVDAGEAAVAGGAEGGEDLGGVVAVVVDDGDVVDDAFDLEAAVDATEGGEAGGDLVGRDAELDADGDGGGGVEDVVAAGDMELEGAEEQAAIVDLEAGVAVGGFREELYAEVGLGIGSVGVDLAAGAGEKRGEERVVEAGGGGAVEGQAVHELEEGVFDVGHVAVAVHVLAVEVSDDAEDGRELEEGTVALVCLGHQVLGSSQPGV